MEKKNENQKPDEDEISPDAWPKLIAVLEKFPPITEEEGKDPEPAV